MPECASCMVPERFSCGVGGRGLGCEDGSLRLATRVRRRRTGTPPERRRKRFVGDTDVHVRGAIDAARWPGNADVDWDDFDSEAYFEHNYGELHAEDRQIIDIVADHFQRWAPHRWRARAVDVGAGANLYPALTMLPFAGHITLSERAFTNRNWLECQLEKPAESWKQFWTAISEGRSGYQRVGRPFEQLHSRAKVAKGNVFVLEP